jgi:hypothetical protein
MTLDASGTTEQRTVALFGGARERESHSSASLRGPANGSGEEFASMGLLVRGKLPAGEQEAELVFWGQSAGQSGKCVLGHDCLEAAAG